jgi:hypothetical protein
MSFNFTLTESETERENLLDGDYVAVIRKVEEKMDKYGTYILVEEELLSPVDVEGRRVFERFYTGAYDEEKQKWGKSFFSRMCKQLLDTRGSLVVDVDALIGKHYIKTVKNNTAANGKTYQNTTNRILIEGEVMPQPEDKAAMYGKLAAPSQETPKQSWPIDDEVPF